MIPPTMSNPHRVNTFVIGERSELTIPPDDDDVEPPVLTPLEYPVCCAPDELAAPPLAAIAPLETAVLPDNKPANP